MYPRVQRTHLFIDSHMSLPISDDAIAFQPGMSLAPLAGVLENIQHGIVLLGPGSEPCFKNSAAKRILGNDGDEGVIARELRALSRAARLDCGGRPAEVEVETREGRYQMRGTLLPSRIRELRSGAVLVTIRCAGAQLPSDVSLMQRFGMTSREADVALLLARGTRNRAIAQQLRISPHTARHHTESVLLKLNVHARSEVSGVICDGFKTKDALQP